MINTSVLSPFKLLRTSAVLLTLGLVASAADQPGIRAALVPRDARPPARISLCWMRPERLPS
jgi:hypothetical protein